MRLIIEDDDGRRAVVPFAQDEISIGRDRGNTIRLIERNVSRHHAILVRRDADITIEDLGSYNGVRVNGDRIQGRHRINEGDLIQIGDYDLAVEDEHKAAPPDRPTQPELEAPRRESASDEDLPFHTGFEARARMQKAAAIQAVLSKGKPRDERDTDPKRPASPADDAPTPTPWPADFHFVAPADIEAAAARSRRGRSLVIGVLAACAIVAAILVMRSSVNPLVAPAQPSVAPAPVPEAVAPASAPEPGAPIVTPLPIAPAQPSVAPAALPAVLAPATAVAPAPVPEKVAVAPALTPALPQKPTSRHRAHDLYQDAVADVGNGDYPAALVKLRDALQLDPASAESHKEIAICYSHLGQPDKGASHYEQYLKLKPDAPDAADVRKMLGDYYASKGGHE